MKKAKQYGLNFKVIQNEGFPPRPIISCDLDAGSSINGAFAEFLGPMGTYYTQYTLDEILSIKNLNGFVVENYDSEEILEFSSPPPMGVFGGIASLNPPYSQEIPFQDILDIMKEWLNFLNTLPSKHALSHLLINKKPPPQFTLPFPPPTNKLGKRWKYLLDTLLPK